MDVATGGERVTSTAEPGGAKALITIPPWGCIEMMFPCQSHPVPTESRPTRHLWFLHLIIPTITFRLGLLSFFSCALCLCLLIQDSNIISLSILSTKSYRVVWIPATSTLCNGRYKSSWGIFPAPQRGVPHPRKC